MKQLLRRLALALSLVTVLVVGQVAVIAAPAHARPGWPPIVVDGGICEDGIEWLVLTRCPVLIGFRELYAADQRFYLTTRPGSAAPEVDYLPLEREPVTVPGGADLVELVLWIVSDGRCEEPENFTLLLSTDDPVDETVPVEIEVIDRAC
ncbi:MAG TPA: hypothetical protein VFC19_23985 [Candidatus Limnocylindrales bacterium]|nr:hypothetical protein [Candidatus Limnocylindrales bacterium]